MKLLHFTDLQCYYGYDVVLCCIMIKVAEGSIVVLKGGGRGAYGRAYSRSLFYDVRTHRIEYSMASNESLKL